MLTFNLCLVADFGANIASPSDDSQFGVANNTR
jgi:hypothetical protein